MRGDYLCVLVLKGAERRIAKPRVRPASFLAVSCARDETTARAVKQSSGDDMSMPQAGLPVIAVTGLAFEARIAQGPGARAIFGLDRSRLKAELEALAGSGAAGIVSFGTAGGLGPSLKPGDIVIASAIVSSGARLPTCPDWARALRAALPFAQYADIAGSDAPVVSAAAKDALWRSTGAAAVDMESHMAAEVAARFGLPFIALRAVIDPTHRAVPSAALAGMRADGKTDVFAVLNALRREPRQLSALLQLAGDARKANSALQRSRKLLGDALGFPRAASPIGEPR